MKREYLYILPFVFNFSCLSAGDSTLSKTKTVTKVILLSKMKMDSLSGSSLTDISLIKTYPTKHTCDEDKRYVNLYFCRNDNSRDTLLVFGYCQQPPAYLANDSDNKNPLAIAKSDIQKRYPDSVFVDVPPSFVIAPGSKFVFARLLPLVE